MLKSKFRWWLLPSACQGTEQFPPVKTHFSTESHIREEYIMVLQDDSKENPLALWLLGANSNAPRAPHSAMHPFIFWKPRSKRQGPSCLFLSKPLLPVSTRGGPGSPKAGIGLALTVLPEAESLPRTPIPSSPFLQTNPPALFPLPMASK